MNIFRIILMILWLYFPVSTNYIYAQIKIYVELGFSKYSQLENLRVFGIKLHTHLQGCIMAIQHNFSK